MRLAAFLEQRKRPAVLLRWDAVVSGSGARSIAVAGALVLICAAPALGNESATVANQLLAAQIADAVSTRALLTMPCACGYETDPLARGVVRSNAGEIAAIVVTNILTRSLFRRAPRVVRAMTVVEGILAGNNFRLFMRLDSAPAPVAAVPLPSEHLPSDPSRRR